MADGKKIVLHCGAPKTGSTSIQYYFGDHDDALRAAGVLCPPRFISKGRVDPLHRALTALRAGQVEERAMTRARLRLQELLEDDAVQTLLLSNEALLGDPLIEGKALFFPDAKATMDQLVRLFEGYEVEIVYFVRDFVTYLPSFYVQEVRRGLSWSLDRYCESFDLEQLSWQPVIAGLRRRFGADHVHVFDHGALMKAPAATLQAAFGAYLPELPAFDANAYQKNRSVGGPVLGVYRLLNWLFVLLIPSGLQHEGRKRMRRWIFTPLGGLSSGTKPSLSARHAAILRAAYDADRAALGL